MSTRFKHKLFAVVGFLTIVAAAKADESDIPDVKKFVAGPMLVSVPKDGDKPAFDVCFARFETSSGTEKLAARIPPVEKSCPDKGDYLNDEQSKLNGVSDAEVEGSTDAKVKLSAQDAREWWLRDTPSMVFSKRADATGKPKWNSFCLLTFVPVIETEQPATPSETQDIFCKRRAAEKGSKRLVCPPPAECAKERFAVAKPKIVSSPDTVVHATSGDKDATASRPLAKDEEDH